jgi:hypothetical protein
VVSIQLQRRIAEQLSALLQVPQVLQLPSLGWYPAYCQGGARAATQERRRARPPALGQPAAPAGPHPCFGPGTGDWSGWVGRAQARGLGLELRSSALPDAIPYVSATTRRVNEKNVRIGGAVVIRG